MTIAELVADPERLLGERDRLVVPAGASEREREVVERGGVGRAVPDTLGDRDRALEVRALAAEDPEDVVGLRERAVVAGARREAKRLLREERRARWRAAAMRGEAPVGRNACAACGVLLAGERRAVMRLGLVPLAPPVVHVRDPVLDNRAHRQLRVLV